MIFKILGALCPLFLIQFSFAQTLSAPKTTIKPVVQKVDIDKGRRAYLSTCIQCHNKDPNIKGPLGPELVDAPLEIMKYKVKTGRYPDVLPKGFIPKRKTKVMRPLPKLEKDVPDIHAWIQSVKKKKPKT